MKEQNSINQAATIQNPVTSKGNLGYLEVILIAAVVTFTGIYGYDLLLAQKIRTFDLQGYMREQKALLRAGEITDEQLKANLDQIEVVLKSEKNNHVVILKDVVLRNGDEIK